MNIKTDVRAFLVNNDLPGLQDLLFQDRRVVPALNRLLYDDEELICWRAVSGLGMVAREAPDMLEKVISRLFWTLNDDSGSIGWFAPQALGEICANDPDLVEDFFPIVITNISHEIFGRGAVWAVGRVAPVRPDLVEDAGDILIARLTNPVLRGLACWSLGRMKWKAAEKNLEILTGDKTVSVIYGEDGFLHTRTVGELAAEALEAFRRR